MKKILLLLQCILSISCLNAMSEKTNNESLQKQLYFRLKQIDAHQKAKNRMKIFSHHTNLVSYSGGSDEKKDNNNELIVHNRTKNNDSSDYGIPLTIKTDNNENDNNSEKSYLPKSFVDIFDIPQVLNNFAVNTLDNIFNGEQNRQKINERQRIINEAKNLELYPNPSPNITYDPGKDYTNCKYGPWTKPLQNKFGKIDIDAMNKGGEYEALHKQDLEPINSLAPLSHNTSQYGIIQQQVTQIDVNNNSPSKEPIKDNPNYINERSAGKFVYQVLIFNNETQKFEEINLLKSNSTPDIIAILNPGAKPDILIATHSDSSAPEYVRISQDDLIYGVLCDTMKIGVPNENILKISPEINKNSPEKKEDIINPSIDTSPQKNELKVKTPKESRGIKIPPVNYDELTKTNFDGLKLKEFLNKNYQSNVQIINIDGKFHFFPKKNVNTPFDFKKLPNQTGLDNKNLNPLPEKFPEKLPERLPENNDLDFETPKSDSGFFNFETPQDTANTINNCVRGVQVAKSAYDIVAGAYYDYQAHKINQKNRLKVKDFVVERYKKTGKYLSSKDAERLDKILSANGMKVTNDTRLRLQQQLAINLIRYPDTRYKNQLTYLEELTMDGAGENKEIIRNLDDIEDALKRRLRSDQLKKENLEIQNNSSFAGRWANKLIIKPLQDLQTSIDDYVYPDTEENLKKRNQEWDDRVKKEKELEEKTKQENEKKEQEAKKNNELREKVRDRISNLSNHMNPEPNKPIDDLLKKEKKIEEQRLNEKIQSLNNINEVNKRRFNQGISEWKVHNPDRFEAYKQTVEQNGLPSTQEYQLSSQAESFLNDNGLNPKDYAVLNGNKLQQQLFSEIISGIERMSFIPCPNSSAGFCHTMHKATIEVLDGARQVNKMGDYVGASNLIDLAKTMTDYCSAVAEGLKDGIKEGIVDGVKGVYNLVFHPIDTGKALGKFALQLSKLLNDYVPLENPFRYKPFLDYSAEKDWKESLQNFERIAKNWNDARKKLLQWWDETPTRDKIYIITKGSSSAITNVIIGDKCLHVAGKVVDAALKEAVVICEKANVKFAGVPLEASNDLLKNISKTELASEVPSTVLLNEIKASTTVLEHGKKLGVSSEKVAAAMETLVEQGGSIDRFGKAVEKLEHVPGVVGKNSNIEKILIPKNKGNIKGAFFELESGLQAIERGEEVLGLNVEITHKIVGTKEFDVVTKNALIECKNWDWASKKSEVAIQELKNGLKPKKIIADTTDKKLILHSKNPIPLSEEFNKFKNWLIENGIDLIEG